MNDQDKRVADFFYELGLLSQFKRSGFDFLGISREQNISSHVFRMAMIGYTLAAMVDNVDRNKVLAMCLFHDVAETRTGDINKFQELYTTKDEKLAITDIADGLPIADDLVNNVIDFETSDSIEAVVARDADVLELIVTLKEELDRGNLQAGSWIDNAVTRLKLDKSKEVATAITLRMSYDWWQDITINKK